MSTSLPEAIKEFAALKDARIAELERKLAEQQAKNAIMREYCWLEHKKLFGKEFDVGEPEELTNLLAKAKEEGRKEAEADTKRLDWLAMYGTFGVDSTSGMPGGNGQRRIAAVRTCIDEAMTASAPKPQGETKCQ